jgi:hypothetical protein
VPTCSTSASCGTGKACISVAGCCGQVTALCAPRCPNGH